MGFSGAVQSGFKNYVQFNGRATRSAFWWWILFAFLIGCAAAILDASLGLKTGSTGSTGPFNALVSLALLLPGLAVTVRRLHDTNHSGWWYLLVFTIIGVIPLLIWFCQAGTPSANKYGGVALGEADDLALAAQSFGHAASPPSTPPRPTDALSRLEQLGRLRDQGVLTAAEFEAEKAKLIGGAP